MSGDKAIIELSKKMDSVLNKMDSNGSTLTDISKRLERVENPTFDAQKTLVITGIRYENDAETDLNDPRLMAKVKEIIDVTGISTTPKNVKRFPGKDDYGGVKPGVVKVELPTTEEKIQILKNKSSLKETHSNVFIRTSHTHTEMVMIQNNKLLLSLLPNGENYFVSSSGKIVERYERQEDPFAFPRRDTRPQAFRRGGPRVRFPRTRGGRGGPSRGGSVRGGFNTEPSYSQIVGGKGRQVSDDSSATNDNLKKQKPSTPPLAGTIENSGGATGGEENGPKN